MKKNYNTLQLSSENKILTAKLYRPEVRNAMNSEMMQELNDFWHDLYLDQNDYRCIILTGHGTQAFCAGADLKERNQMDVNQWQRQHAILEQMVRAMIECPLPIIAAVNGATFGGGLEIMLACDFAYAATNAIFSQSEVRLGIMPGAMATQQLPRAIGSRRAREICYTGKIFDAQTAKSWGLINEVYDAEELFLNVKEITQQIAVNAPLAVRQLKQSLTMAEQTDLFSGYAFELQAYQRLVATQDRIEGIRAFNEKRKPHFEGK